MDTQLLFVETLKTHGLSHTKQRQQLFDYLLASHEPVTMNQIIQAHAHVMNRTTVYRIIESLEKAHVVIRVQTGWKYKLELSDQFSHHHHHFLCTTCGQTTPFEEHDAFEATLHALESSYGFTIKSHTIELVGLCGRCRNQA
jgi:Fur family transcriptional regulator, ferric uptake regulator